MKNPHNMGGLDRLGRLITGLVLLSAGLVGWVATGWQVVALAGATLFLTTAAVGFCPGYIPFGINTCRRRFDEPLGGGRAATAGRPAQGI